MGLRRAPYLLPFCSLPLLLTASNQVRKWWTRLASRVQGNVDFIINNTGLKEAHFKCMEIKTNGPLLPRLLVEEDQVKEYFRKLDMRKSHDC